MSGTNSRQDGGVRPRVVIAGGGVGALEAVLALRAHAGDGVEIELLCPDARFEYRPLSVLEAFDVTPGWSVALDAFAAEHGVELRRARLAAVDPDAHRLRTDEGDEVAYDALLIAIGSRATESLPGALAFGGHADALALRGMLDHLDYGQAHRLAFVAPDPTAWVVPLYELALLARARLDAHHCDDAEITVITAEADPLEMLGERSVDIAAMLLVHHGITVRAAVRPLAVEERTVVLAGGARIAADHIVTLPRFEGVPLPGIPQDPRGFIPIDDHCAITGVADVYAAGDITAGFPKQGGLAARQADAAAEAILAALGFPVSARAFAPIIEGVLLTGEVLAAFDGSADDAPAKRPWRAPTKIAARYLAPYLDTREPASHFPAQWQATRTLPGEIEIGGAILEPTERELLAMRRLPTFDIPAGADTERARKSARAELGALAADDESTRQLRESLRSYLAAGCSLEAAAFDLGCPASAVKEAITRGEEILGHDITDRLPELRMALEVTARDMRHP